MKITHEKLRELMHVFGYNSNEDGICNGFTWMWIQAQLLGEEGAARFRARLNILEKYQDKFDQLKNEIREMQQAIILNAGHPEIQKELQIKYSDFLEILSFCEGIELYHSPELHPEFYVTEFLQSSSKPDTEQQTDPLKIQFQQNNLGLISPTTASTQLGLLTQFLNIKPTLTALANDCFILNSKACCAYFYELKSWFDEHQDSFGAQRIIPIKLGTDNHAIACSYNLDTQQWQFLDINDDEEEYVRDILNIEDLTENLKLSFDDEEILLFHLMPVVINPYGFSTQSIESLKEINKKHQDLSKERATLKNNRQASLPYLASKFGDVEVMQTLVDLDVDINATKLNGSSPLCIACQNKELKVVELLVNHGARVNHSKLNGDTPLNIASRVGDSEIVGLLLRNKADVNAVNQMGYTPLMTAVITNNLNMVEQLLKGGADPNLSTKERGFPIDYALRSSDSKILDLLVNNGARPDIIISKGLTPLINSIYSERLDLFHVLINKKADLDFPDVDGITPLYWACMMGKENVISVILEKGINSVNTVCDSGHTPLLVACLSEYTHQNLKLFQALLKHGASLDARNDEGQSALEIALINKNPAAIRALLMYMKANNKDYKAFLSSDMCSNPETIGYLDSVMAFIDSVALIQMCGVFNRTLGAEIKAEVNSLEHN